jgi:hypothetical protein
MEFHTLYYLEVAELQYLDGPQRKKKQIIGFCHSAN